MKKEDKCLKHLKKGYLCENEELLFGISNKDIGQLEFYQDGTYELSAGNGTNVFENTPISKELLMLLIMSPEEIKILNDCRAEKGLKPVACK